MEADTKARKRSWSRALRVESAKRQMRGCQVRRCLVILSLLRPLRQGADLYQITTDVIDITGEKISPKSIDRDLAILEGVGVVERYKRTYPGPGEAKFLYKVIRVERMITLASLGDAIN